MKLKEVSPDSLLELLNLCSGTSVSDMGYIKRRYEDNFLGFESNLEFLRKLGLVDTLDDSLRSASLSTVTKSHVTDALCRNIGQFPELEEFLSRFHVEDDALVLRPTRSQIVKYADARRILAGFGLLEVTSGACRIRNDTLVSQARVKPMSLDTLKRNLHMQEIAGIAAERFVLELELSQVAAYPEVVSESVVKHIAPHDVAAGYDIESFCKKAAARGRYERIYIEVKAVSSSTCQFYWSRNEMRAAQKLGKHYYLYLVKAGLPDSGCGDGGDDKVVVICNPYETVLCNPRWTKEVETISFRLGGDGCGR